MGYRKLEEADEEPDGHGATPANNEDPYPVQVYGEPKTIPDSQISKHMTDDFFYYNNIHENIASFGLPYKWPDAPQWVLWLFRAFKGLDQEWENHLIRRQHNQT